MLSYQMIACGVNQGAGATRLRFAEKDATDVAGLFLSGLGPLQDPNLQLLLGREASVRRVRRALLVVEAARPDCFVFYFSGHGSADGVLCSDGLLHFAALRDHLQAIDAQRMIVVLDVCHAAAFAQYLPAGQVGGLAGILDPDWIELIATATPGTRLLFSAGADRTAGEGGGVPNGHFTYAWTEALIRSPGDLRGRRGRWVSDRRSFAVARKILRDELGVRQEPVGLGVNGDFPLVRSGADEVVGEATVCDILQHLRSVEVTFAIGNRRLLTTYIRLGIYDAQGQLLWQSEGDVVPEHDCVRCSEVFERPVLVWPPLRTHQLASAAWSSGTPGVAVTWRVEIEDERRRRLCAADHTTWLPVAGDRTGSWC